MGSQTPSVQYSDLLNHGKILRGQKNKKNSYSLLSGPGVEKHFVPLLSIPTLQTLEKVLADIPSTPPSSFHSNPPARLDFTDQSRGQPKVVKAPEIKHWQRCVAPLTCVTQFWGREERGRSALGCSSLNVVVFRTDRCLPHSLPPSLIYPPISLFLPLAAPSSHIHPSSSVSANLRFSLDATLRLVFRLRSLVRASAPILSHWKPERRRSAGREKCGREGSSLSVCLSVCESASNKQLQSVGGKSRAAVTSSRLNSAARRRQSGME